MTAVVAPGAEPGQWRLVNRTTTGADVLVQAEHRPAAAPWRRSLQRLRDSAGRLSVAATDDGHFRWVFTGEDGRVVAESPAAHRDAESCRLAFADAQRAARIALNRG
ncbi:hypothetical protein [Actinoplanes sp. NPDC020271]|uniref:hypothetical protein n=1 Tax=Actinoplanes sp. NPDC020271 TaxID=3363896 RepID=UPI0037BC9195